MTDEKESPNAESRPSSTQAPAQPPTTPLPVSNATLPEPSDIALRVAIEGEKLVSQGHFDEERITELLLTEPARHPGCSGSWNPLSRRRNQRPQSPSRRQPKKAFTTDDQTSLE
jgi:hypothetical protein